MPSKNEKNDRRHYLLKLAKSAEQDRLKSRDVWNFFEDAMNNEEAVNHDFELMTTGTLLLGREFARATLALNRLILAVEAARLDMALEEFDLENDG